MLSCGLHRYAKFRALGRYSEHIVKGGDWRTTNAERAQVRCCCAPRLLPYFSYDSQLPACK